MALLFGKPVADKILRKIRAKITEQKLAPGLGVILVGDDPASHLYVGFKEKAAEKVGIRLEKNLLPAQASVSEVFQAIDAYNAREDIHGILVQIPLPPGFPTDEIIDRIAPEKDTDGFHQKTMERFMGGDITACPVFPRAVFELLLSTGANLSGKVGLVLANSEILGKMMGKVLSSFGMVGDYILASEEEGLRGKKIGEADVIVTACGLPGLITGSMVREGVIIIDGGITEREGKVVGDVDRKSVLEKGTMLSPVPGGVGPVTVACLLARVTEAALKKAH